MKLKEFARSYYWFIAISYKTNHDGSLSENAIYFKDSDNLERLLSGFGDLEFTDASIFMNSLGYIKIILIFGDTDRYVKFSTEAPLLGSMKLPDEIKAAIALSEAP